MATDGSGVIGTNGGGSGAPGAGGVPVAAVRDALAHLHDPAFFRAHAEPTRQSLLATIEGMKPHAGTSPASRAWRPYRILRERYVEALDAATVQRHIGLGKTQYHAEHRRALRMLAELLTGGGRGAAGREGEDGRHSGRYQGTGDGRARGRSTTLTQLLSSFVGRERETAELPRALQRARLLTLVGSGGCGKTRLAWRVAADVLGAYRDGVWAAELAPLPPLAHPDQVAARVAQALTVREAPGLTVHETLAETLRSRHLLLILDNCEHLLDAAARFAETLLAACGGLTILATSREALGVAGETVWQVRPLDVPADGAERELPLDALGRCESVQLFVDRAAAAAPGFALTPGNAAAVAQICRRLDGIPLALELAAARLPALTPAEIAARLDRRFALLCDGRRTALPRHRTLGALVEWSYGLLDSGEQYLFRQLSVFVGGFTLEGAEAVLVPARAAEAAEDGGASVAALVLRLVGKSLVVAEPAGDQQTRYRLLETLRQFGRERLDDAERRGLAGRHAAFYLGLAEGAVDYLRSREQLAWLQHLDAEHENVVTALRTLLEESRGGEALRLAAALGWYCLYRGRYAEGRAHLERALAADAASGAAVADAAGGLGGETTRMPAAPERVTALAAAGTLAWAQGHHEAADALLVEGIGLAREIGDRAGAALCATMLSSVAFLLRDDARRRAFASEALEAWREIGDKWGLAWALQRWGTAIGDEFVEGRKAERAARSLEAREEAVELWREVGDRWGLSFALVSLAHHPWIWRDRERAEGLLREALRAARELGDSHNEAYALSSLGLQALHAGDYGAAAAYFDEGIAIARERGLRRNLANLLTRAARVAYARGDLARVRRLLDEASGVVAVSAEAEYWYGKLSDATAGRGAALSTVI